MHQSKNFKTSLTRAGLSIRAFFLSVLLMGSVLTFISAIASEQVVFAQGSPKMSQHHLTKVQPLAIVSSRKALQSKGSLAPQVLKGKKGLHLPQSSSARHDNATFGTTKIELTPAGVTTILTPTGATTATPTDIMTATSTDTTTATSTATTTAAPAATTLASANTTAATPTDTTTATPTDTTTATPTDTTTATPTDTTTATSTATTTATSTATTTATSTATTTATPTGTKPQLFITNSSTDDGSMYVVGQPITYNLVVSNLPFSLPENQTVTVQDAIPSGITSLTATGNNWNISLTATTGPAMLSATYVGMYPIAAGDVLPPITLSGNLTDLAVPSFTTSGTVNSSDDPNPALNTSVNTIFVSAEMASPTATTSVTAVPSTTATATASTTALPLTPPALAIVKTNLDGDHFKVGDQVTYIIVVSDSSTGGPVMAPNTISVSDAIPVGLKDIHVDAPQWSISISDKTSPAIIDANFSGIFPVASGEVLSPIAITGTLTEDAVSSITDTATVDTLGNDPSNNFATDTIFVKDNNKDNNNKDNNNKDNNNHHHNNDNGDNGSNGKNGKNGDNGSNGKNGKNGTNGTNGSSDPFLPGTGGAPLKI